MGGQLLEKEIITVPQYMRNKFIETGTYKGDTASLAAKYFSEVHTIEINPTLVQISKENLQEFSNVHVYEGKSQEILEQLGEVYKEGAVFFIDAHGGYPDDTRDAELPVPVLKELDVILSHLNKEREFIFILDDISQFESPHNPDFINIKVNDVVSKFKDLKTLIYSHNDRLWIWVNTNHVPKNVL
jgi:hypothetical protein